MEMEGSNDNNNGMNSQDDVTSVDVKGEADHCEAETSAVEKSEGNDHGKTISIDNDENTTPNDNRPHSAITEKLNRELALSNTHRLQFQGHWRQILSKEKFQELSNAIPQLKKYHDENISRKKNVIDSLQGEIQHLQELYQDAMVANMNRMEDLIAIHNDQVVKLERNFRDKVSSLQSQFHADVDQINTQYSQEKEAVNVSIQRQAERDEAQLQSLQQEHQHELEEIKNRNLEYINSLRFVMDSRLEELEEKFELTHGEFAQSTDGTRAAYDQLKTKDDAIRAEIESKARIANNIQREIQRFQLIARQEEARITERREELLSRKARAIARWNNTQEEMSKFREGQRNRLVKLIKRANDKKEVLRKQCELADRVKKIALACQKWESSREKFASLLRESNCPKLTSAEKEEGEDIGDNDDRQQKSYIIGCMGQLGDTTHHFWNKYNMAKLDVLTLERKVRQLKQREQDLKSKLKQYHDGITVNNDVLKDRNPLLVINGKMNAMPQNDGNGGLLHPGGKKRVLRRLTVVDGNHFFATNNLTQVA